MVDVQLLASPARDAGAVPVALPALPEPAARELRWSFLGRVPYRAAVTLQEELRQGLRDAATRRTAQGRRTDGGQPDGRQPDGGQPDGWQSDGRQPDGGQPDGGQAQEGAPGPRTEHLLLLEHPHVYTLGRNASAEDVLASAEWLERQGVEVVESDRGGQVTYHGPGQLVGYPILDLSPDRRDVRRYVRDLEEVLIRTLAGYGIAAEVRPGAALIGVWAGGEKIAAIGIHLSRWITTHGFALNVATDLSLYAGIVPCGLRQERVTSMAKLLGAAPPLAEVAQRLAGHFGEVFARRLVAAAPPRR